MKILIKINLLWPFIVNAYCTLFFCLVNAFLIFNLYFYVIEFFQLTIHMLMYLRGLLDVNKKFLLNFYTFISSNWILFLNGFEVIRNIAQILKFIKFANFVNIIQNLFFNPRWFQINRECDHLNPCNQSKYIHILLIIFRYILINSNIFEIFDNLSLLKN